MTEHWTETVFSKIVGLLPKDKNVAKEKLIHLLRDHDEWHQRVRHKSNQRALKAVVTQSDALMSSMNKLTRWDKGDLDTLMRLTITKQDILAYDGPNRPPISVNNPLFQLFLTARNFSNDEHGIPKGVRRMITVKWIEPPGDIEGPDLTEILHQKLKRVNRSASALIKAEPRKGQAAKVDRDVCILCLWDIFLHHGPKFDTEKLLRKSFRTFVRALNGALPAQITLGTEESIKKVLEKLRNSGGLNVPKRK